MDVIKLISKAASEKEESRRASRTASSIDFSKLIRMGFNEHPYGMSPKALQAIIEESKTSNLYGDFQKKEITEKLAMFYDLEPENILAGAGSSPLIETVGCAF